MTGNDEDRIEPKLAETGFFKTVHEVIEKAAIQYDTYMASINGVIMLDQHGAYGYARSTLLTLYHTVVLPHNLNNPDDPGVKDFEDKWKSLDEKYGIDFEKGKEIDFFNTRERKEAADEITERFSLIMTYLNALGITKLRERGEKWEDSEIDFYEEQLK